MSKYRQIGDTFVAGVLDHERDSLLLDLENVSGDFL